MVTLPISGGDRRGQHTMPCVEAERTKHHFGELLDTLIVKKIQIFRRQSSQGDILDHLALQILRKEAP